VLTEITALARLELFISSTLPGQQIRIPVSVSLVNLSDLLLMKIKWFLS
jgi:hypothetical protein